MPVRRKTKNHRLVNGLASFDAAIDCAAANNRLKRRRKARANFRFAPELALNIRIKTFSQREPTDSRQENALPPRGVRVRGNRESHERDIRDKI
jgi:hypothetical protein